MTNQFKDFINNKKTPEQMVLALPNVAIIVMGWPGAGKTYFLGTAPKPIVVQQFDPPDKSITYEDLGFIPGPVERAEYCFYQNFFSKTTGKWLVRVEFFSEADPRNAKAVDHYMARMNSMEKDIQEWGVRTVGLDSITFLELAARYHNKYTFHPTNKSGESVQNEMIHYAASSRFVEEFVMGRYPGLRNLCNVIVLAHIIDKAYEEGEDDVKMPGKMIAAPGKLPGKITGAYSEVYRLYVDKSGAHRLQTADRHGNMYQCKSLRHVPDGIPAHFKAISQFLEQKYNTILNGMDKEEVDGDKSQGPEAPVDQGVGAGSGQRQPADN